MTRRTTAAAVALALLSGGTAFAQQWTGGTRPAPVTDGRPKVLTEVGFDQKLGGQVPLDTTFRDEAGRTVRLGDYFGKRPVVLVLAYYECPMLCTVTLNGLASALDILKFDPGKEFEIVTVSFDPREKPALAAAKKATYLKRYKRAGAAEAWHFLTGDADQIRRLTSAVGFRYAWDDITKQFAHPTGVMVTTPDGRLARYLYGVEYSPKDLRFAIFEAAQGKILSPVDSLLLYCYHYDPTQGKYGATVMAIVRAAGVVTLLGLGALIVTLKRREKVA